MGGTSKHITNTQVARSTPFDNSTNGFTSTDTQSAIEEAKAAGASIATKYFYADQVDSPNSANWAINANAPASSDSANLALLVRRFDDTLEEGVGFEMFVPSIVTTLTFGIKARAQTAPGAAQTVVMRLYNRQIPNNAAVTAWSAALQLTTLSVPTNAFYQYYIQAITLATLGITAGRTVQFELTRHGVNGSDTLVGDWDLLELSVGMS